MGEWATVRKHRMMPSMLGQQHRLSPKPWVSEYFLRWQWMSHCSPSLRNKQWTQTQCLCPTAPGPAEARRPAHPACRPGGRKPNAGAVRQNGRRQHQNEALDGGDLCAFNRQRKAVVQVEVTSFSPSSPSLLLTVAKVKWCGLEQATDHKGLHCAACWIFLLLPYHTKELHVSFHLFLTPPTTTSSNLFSNTCLPNKI